MSHTTYFAIHGHTNLCIEVKQKNIWFFKEQCKIKQQVFALPKTNKS